MTADQFYKDHIEFLNPKKLIVRIYILKCKALTPKDSVDSDPYIEIQLGDTVRGGKDTMIPNTNFPGFFTHFDLPTSLPGPSTLRIKVWDDDGYARSDFIGETEIDVEDRYFSKEWRQYMDSENPKIPLEERALYSPESEAPSGIV